MKRVVVTGMGIVSPLGNNITEFWENIVNGKSGANLITKFDTQLFKTKFACEVKNFNPEVYLTHNEIKRSDLYTQYALYAAGMAIENSNLTTNSLSPYDIGVIWGTGQGGLATFENEMKIYVKDNFVPRFTPFFIPQLITNMAAGMIAIKHNFRGINYCAVSACATTNTVIMDAFNL